LFGYGSWITPSRGGGVAIPPLFGHHVRELPGGVNAVGHPDLTPAPTLTSLWCGVTTNSSVGTAMLDAAFVEVGRLPRNTLTAEGSWHDEMYLVREFGTTDE